MELGRRENNKRGKNNKLFLVMGNEGRTIWHLAAKEGTLEIFLQLLVWGIDKLTKRGKIINN